MRRADGGDGRKELEMKCTARGHIRVIGRERLLRLSAYRQQPQQQDCEDQCGAQFELAPHA